MNLLFGAADVLQVGDEGALALVQRSFQLLERAVDLAHCLVLALRQLLRDLVHRVDGCRQLGQPVLRARTACSLVHRCPWTEFTSQALFNNHIFNGCQVISKSFFMLNHG